MNIIRVPLGFLVILLMGCGDSTSSSTGAQSAGVSMANASPVQRTWGEAFVSWPSQGDPGRIAKTPLDHSSYNLWHDIRVSPKDEVSEPVIEIIETSKKIIDPLHGLNGEWAGPATDGAKISSRTIRGLAKSIWSDLRLAVRTDDRARAVNDLVLLGNMPRVAREIDPSDRGLIPALAVAGILHWGIVDVNRGGEVLRLTPEECARVVAATMWINEPQPFGKMSEQNLPTWEGFQKREIPKLREAMQELCGE